MTTTFLTFLTEEYNDSNTANYIFDFQILKRKLIPKLGLVIDKIEDEYEIPSRDILEFIDILQLIKRIMIVNINDDDFKETFVNKVKNAIKYMYHDSNTSEFLNYLETELLDVILNNSVNKLKQDIDMLDYSMDSADEFGKLMFRLYDKYIKYVSEYSANDLSEIKRWINKIKSSSTSINGIIKDRSRLKFKLYDKINKDEEEVEEVEAFDEDNFEDDTK